MSSSSSGSRSALWQVWLVPWGWLAGNCVADAGNVKSLNTALSCARRVGARHQFRVLAAICWNSTSPVPPNSYWKPPAKPAILVRKRLVSSMILLRRITAKCFLGEAGMWRLSRFW